LVFKSKHDGAKHEDDHQDREGDFEEHSRDWQVLSCENLIEPVNWQQSEHLPEPEVVCFDYFFICNDIEEIEASRKNDHISNQLINTEYVDHSIFVNE